MAREPENENEPRAARRRWFHPRKSDFAFVAGMAVFLFQGLRGQPSDPTMVYGSIALMGFSVAGRVDGLFGDGGRR